MKIAQSKEISRGTFPSIMKTLEEREENKQTNKNTFCMNQSYRRKGDGKLEMSLIRNSLYWLH